MNILRKGAGVLGVSGHAHEGAGVGVDGHEAEAVRHDLVLQNLRDVDVTIIQRGKLLCAHAPTCCWRI